ncbi:MAG: hypothetical protein ABWK53_12590 [Anaerolineales bacterium]
MPLKRLELFLAAAAALLLWGALARFAPGGPLSSDVLWYLNVGLTGTKDPFILNRYFHVFLELLFVRAGSTPLAGVQTYWAFLVAGIAFFIYLNARLAADKSTPLHGLLAFGVFFSLSDLAKWAGTPFVDLTLALLLSLAVTFYLLACRRPEQIGWLLLLGFIFSLGLRTKETMLIAALLLPGLGFDAENRFDLRPFLIRLAYLISGALIGIVIYGGLCALVLKDPFFGWRLAEIQEFRASYVQNFDAANYAPDSTNWYTGFALRVIYIPFILYLLSGARTAPKLDWPYRLLWLLPLGGLLFLMFTANNIWGFESRHLLPSYAVLAALAPQFIDFRLPTEKNSTRRAWLLLTAALLLPVGLRFALRPLVYAEGIDFGQFLDILFHPLLLTLLLGALFLTKHETPSGWFIPIFCIVGLLTSPLLANARLLFIEHPNQALARFDFYPFSQFAAHIEVAPATRIYVDSDISAYVQESNRLQVPMLATDRNELTSMFNVYFDARAGASQFSLSSSPEEIAADLLAGDYDYAFLTVPHWSSLAGQPEVAARLQQQYQLYTEPQGLVVLLASR